MLLCAWLLWEELSLYLDVDENQTASGQSAIILSPEESQPSGEVDAAENRTERHVSKRVDEWGGGDDMLHLWVKPALKSAFSVAVSVMCSVMRLE